MPDRWDGERADVSIDVMRTVRAATAFRAAEVDPMPVTDGRPASGAD